MKNFIVSKDMVENGKIIKGKVPDIIEGSFTCERLGLTTLENGPRIVKYDFSCNRNNLTDLEFGPIEVGNNYSCSNNELTTLKGIPEILNNGLWCQHNNLNNLKHFPRIVKSTAFVCGFKMFIEKKFVNSKFYNYDNVNNYYTDLIEFLVYKSYSKEEILKYVYKLPNFLNLDNIIKSIKSKQKFNL